MRREWNGGGSDIRSRKWIFCSSLSICVGPTVSVAVRVQVQSLLAKMVPLRSFKGSAQFGKLPEMKADVNYASALQCSGFPSATVFYIDTRCSIASLAMS